MAKEKDPKEKEKEKEKGKGKEKKVSDPSMSTSALWRAWRELTCLPKSSKYSHRKKK